MIGALREGMKYDGRSLENSALASCTLNADQDDLFAQMDGMLARFGFVV